MEAVARPLKPLEDRALLAEIARALVSSPVHVRVEEVQEPGNALVLRLYVLPRDRGRIIGKRGQTLTIIRRLFSAIGRLDGRQVLVELDEEPDPNIGG